MDGHHRHNPHLYEINCRVWLRRLREKFNRKLTLRDIPDEIWRQFKHQGFDYIWLMGVWAPSNRELDIAMSLPSLQTEYSKALPTWNRSDVIGSPYAIASYELNPELGSPDDLQTVRDSLHKQGLDLILDFVPNHMALDHPWTILHPEYFVQGNEEDAKKYPELFFTVSNEAKSYYLAHGKDPHFPPWSDTAQINYFNPDNWEPMITVLNNVAEVCDGVRCDVAMLLLNEVFQKTWGPLIEKSGFTKPSDEFWKAAITKVKLHYPNLLLIAESYWGLNRELLKLGFDYVYDKELYDLMLYNNARDIYAYLQNDSLYQRSCVRFVENHDERRALEAFGREKSKAAAAIISTVMGMRLYHEGQFEGRTVKTPLQLSRVKSEQDDIDLIAYYEKLLRFANLPSLHNGEWILLETRGVSPEDRSYESLLAWMWKLEDVKIIIANYSTSLSQGFVIIPLERLGNDGVTIFYDELTGKKFPWSRAVLADQGLYVRLEAYQVHLFTLLKGAEL